MITLFYCPRCKEYTRKGAQVSALVNATLDPVSGGLIVENDFIIPVYRYKVEDIAANICPECGGPTELVHLDECPHNWHVGIVNPTTRKCRLCGQAQRGRVVFNA